MKLLIIFLFLSVCLNQSAAYIDIQIDPDDLHRVSEFFQSIMINNHPQTLMVPRSSGIRNPRFQRAMIAGVKLVGVIFAITTSNLLSDILGPYVRAHPHPSYPSDISVFVKNFPHCTSTLQPEPQQRSQVKEIEEQLLLYKNILADIDSKSVKKEFGCHKNVCWRDCYKTPADGKKSFWCFSSPKPLEKKYYPCAFTTDCSADWECLDECHN